MPNFSYEPDPQQEDLFERFAEISTAAGSQFVRAMRKSPTDTYVFRDVVGLSEDSTVKLIHVPARTASPLDPAISALVLVDTRRNIFRLGQVFGPDKDCPQGADLTALAGYLLAKYAASQRPHP